jgi:hypothetical protein
MNEQGCSCAAADAAFTVDLERYPALWQLWCCCCFFVLKTNSKKCNELLLRVAHAVKEMMPSFAQGRGLIVRCGLGF